MIYYCGIYEPGIRGPRCSFSLVLCHEVGGCGPFFSGQELSVLRYFFFSYILLNKESA